MKLKHNKRRNTAFLYEALTRELTKAVLASENERKRAVVEVVKEFFHSGRELAKDLALYRAVYDTRGAARATAERILREAKDRRLAINRQRLYDEQSALLEAVNRRLGPDVLNNFMPHFKCLASLNQVFSGKTPIKTQVLLENLLVKFMTITDKEQSAQTVSNLDNLTYRIFVKKFADKYGKLNECQTKLLNKFVIGGLEDSDFRTFLAEEVERLKSTLTVAMTQVNEVKGDSINLMLVGEIVKSLEELARRELQESDVTAVLKAQDLAQELLSNGN